MSALGAKSEAALRAAMARLLDGRPERTDGALTVSNLAREAGVSRATENRAVGLLAEFRAAEARHRRSSPRPSRSASAHSKPSCAPCAAPRTPNCAALSARSPSTSRC
ncbi:hypothetical protein ABIA15_004926 [Sinorhizobium fredii]